MSIKLFEDKFETITEMAAKLLSEASDTIIAHFRDFLDGMPQPDDLTDDEALRTRTFNSGETER